MLPKENDGVIIYVPAPKDPKPIWKSDEDIVTYAFYYHNGWDMGDEHRGYEPDEVTHWMPMPEPPSKDTYRGHMSDDNWKFHFG